MGGGGVSGAMRRALMPHASPLQGDHVSLLRSSGAWEAAVVQEVKEASYVIAFTGNTKEIPFRLSEKFLRPAEPAFGF